MTVNPGPGTYEGQLAGRAAELLPGLGLGERLGLLAAMTPDDMRAGLAWLASHAPQMFDFLLVRDRALAARLTGEYPGAARPRRGRDVPEAADIAWDRTHPDPYASWDGGEPPAGGAR